MKTKELFCLKTWSVSTPYADCKWQFLSEIFGRSILYIPLWKNGRPTLTVKDNDAFRIAWTKYLQPDLTIFMMNKRLYIADNNCLANTTIDQSYLKNKIVFQESLLQHPFKSRFFGFLVYLILKIKLYNLKRKTK